MKLKLLVPAIAGAASLALAGPALAIQTLTVTPEEYVVGGSGDFTISVAQETADPAKYASNPSNLGCTGQATHAAVWLLNLTLAGQTLPVPVYVDRVTTGAETGFAGLKLQVCFSSPDVPASAGG